MKTINGTQFYNVAEVAEKLGVHVQTIRNLVKRGAIRAVRIGHAHYIAGADMDEYLGITQQVQA